MIFWNDINWEKLFADYGVKFESVSDDAKPINYYNPIRLFTEPDVDGEFAGVAITCSNRSAGKTSAFAAASCILCKEYGLQTGWIFRTKGEMTGAAAMYEDMLQMYPKLGSVITYKNLDKNGNVVRYFLDGEPKGLLLPDRFSPVQPEISPLFIVHGFLLLLSVFINLSKLL